MVQSPSLRGSGLKSIQASKLPELRLVSLFTREWIEILKSLQQTKDITASPSLRGSGLKCKIVTVDMTTVSLPLYEGVD